MSIPFENQLSTILSPIFGSEFYPIAHPDVNGDSDDVTNMFAIYTIVGGQSLNQLDGDNPISRTRVQVSIYSIDYTELKTAQRAVATAMILANQLASHCVDVGLDQFSTEGALSNVSVTVPQEGREDDTRRFYTHCEFYAWTQN